jgi:SAM-dependent methyltransferase
MDSHSMAFPDSSFDAVWIAGVLHHMDIDLMAKEIHRILKPGGRVVCQEPLNYGPVMWAIRQLWLRLNGLREYNETEFEEFFDGEQDFAAFEKMFRTAHARKFNFIAKTNRLRNRFGWFADLLRWTDYLVLTYMPFFRRYCTCIVCCYEK